jgi:hypothetical protein
MERQGRSAVRPGHPMRIRKESKTMRAARRPGYGFKVLETAAGWSWTAYDREGRPVEQGAAPSRAAAAACIIRVIARAAEPQDAAPRSAVG